MKISISIDFVLGAIFGISATLLVSGMVSGERYSAIIKAHQDGRIACNNVGNELICREVQK